MALARPSRLQRRILARLWVREQQFKGTMAASHQDLVRALGHDKGNLSHFGEGESSGIVSPLAFSYPYFCQFSHCAHSTP